MFNVVRVMEILCDQENSTFYLSQQIIEFYLGVSAVQSAALSNTTNFCIRGMLRPTENIPRPCFAMATSYTANIATWTHISVISWNNSSRGGKQEQFQFSSGAWENVLLLHCRPEYLSEVWLSRCRWKLPSWHGHTCYCLTWHGHPPKEPQHLD